jgi:hypothetical protein
MEDIPFRIDSKKSEAGSLNDSDFYYNFTHTQSIIRIIC